MAKKNSPKEKKYFTVAQANATLPLVQAIVQDIALLARDLQERHERLRRVLPSKGAGIGDAYREEILQVQADFDRDRERMEEYEQELKSLGVELKDYNTGLIDFPCWMDDREVYLCWKLGEPDIGHWHEVDAGFAGRRKLMLNARQS
jgi:hypothetical protein